MEVKDAEKIFTKIRKTFLLKRKIEKRIEDMEKTIGLDKIKYLGHIQGTNCEEWKCNGCSTVYVSPNKCLCPKCIKKIKGSATKQLTKPMKTLSIEKCLRHLEEINEELNNENHIAYNKNFAKEIAEARQELIIIKGGK